jgi:hypothetical protein
MKHTKGPWILSRNNRFIHNGDLAHICDAANDTIKKAKGE